ncbi:HS12A-like protein, partial [Mya arenaria]
MAGKLFNQLGSMFLSKPTNQGAVVIIGLDFGTTYSGYAFMFTNDPTSIYTAMGEEREPTCVLLNPDKTFNAFGKQALEKYTELEPDEHQSYYVFHHFKMKLYECKKLTRETTLQDQTGKEIKAMDVYRIVLQYFKQRPLKLREDKSKEKFPVGHKYILADLGGGTIDICVHEILESRTLCELYRATGDYAGGSRVNHEFEQFFIRLFGAPALDQFRSEFAYAYQEFINSVETKKSTFSQSTKKLIFLLDYDYVTLVAKENGESIQEMISESRYKDLVQYKKASRRLILNNLVVKEFFDSSVDVIIDKLKEILSACSQDNITSLLLVGGYSESPYVRERIQQEFSQLTTMVLADGRLAVMKGALMMGLKPRNIIQRRARFTYGFSSNPGFKEGEHPEQFKANFAGVTMCTGVFEKLIERGQVLQYQQEFSMEAHYVFKSSQNKQMIWHVSLWRSPWPNPRYCFLKEDQCKRVGRISMQPPPGGWPNEAVEKYTELEPEEHQSYYLFHHFKMKLYESDKLTRETTLQDQTGKEIKAMDVYRIVLQYFKQRDKSTEKFPVGHKYILADLGGGTIDICVHEILESRTLCELYRATGDYAGGSRVNHEFEQFLVRLFGAPALDEFRSELAHTYQELLSSIERKKCAFSHSTDKVVLQLDYDFVTLVENENGETIEEMIKSSRYKDLVQYRKTGRRLTLNNSVVKGFFDSSVDVIIDNLKQILCACPRDNITSLLLVGGYSESPYVRERIQQEFPQLTTVIVENGRQAVMKGAVMMGLKPRNIIQRRARFTYGFRSNPKFIEGKHPEQLKYNNCGETWCNGVFNKLIERGQLLQHQQEFSMVFYNTFSEQERQQ